MPDARNKQADHILPNPEMVVLFWLTLIKACIILKKLFSENPLKPLETTCSPAQHVPLIQQAVWLASTLAGPLLAGGGTFTAVAPRQGEIEGGQWGSAAVQTAASEICPGAGQGGAAVLQGPLKLGNGPLLMPQVLSLSSM